VKIGRVGERCQLPAKPELSLGKSLSQKGQQLSPKQAAKNPDRQEELLPAAYPA